MNIGYACMTIGVPYANFKRCILKNALNDKLNNLIESNLDVLNTIIDYNIENGIKLFRLCSDIIPFGSHWVNVIPWWETYDYELNLLSEKIKNNNIRVSMHPGAYTILNSPKEEVIEKSIKDLEYHNKFLECIGANSTNKLVIHIGGVYGDREKAKERFIENYKRVDNNIKEKLVIENDDYYFNIADTLEVSEKTGIPVIYDKLHNDNNPFCGNYDDNYWINQCKKTWQDKDGAQKIHYSEQHPERRKGSHSETIMTSSFLNFYNKLNDNSIDIMLEVKDKNISAIKCNNLIRPEFSSLEKEWERYKYKILEKSELYYQELSALIKNKESIQVEKFYQLIEQANILNDDKVLQRNAAFCVWQNLKNNVTEKEKQKFDTCLKNFEQGKCSIKAVKCFLYRLALSYKMTNLINSYYFLL